MAPLQAKIGRNGQLYYERIDLINHIMDIQERNGKGDPRAIGFTLRYAVDGSYIFKRDGKLLGQEHPGVPEMEGDAGRVKSGTIHVQMDDWAATNSMKKHRKKKQKTKQVLGRK